MKDIAKSAVQQLGKRILDPFAGLCMSFLGTWNWKPLFVVLFDSGSMIQRITYVENTYFADPISILARTAPPLLLAIAYFFGYPWLKAKFVLFHERRALTLRKQQQDLAAMPENEPRLESLERDRKQLHATSPLLIGLYKTAHQIDEGAQISVVRCEVAERGNWVSIAGNDIRIASADPKELRRPAAVVLQTIGDGYVFVQHTGIVSWSVFEGLIKPPTGNPTMFLDANGGITQTKPSKGFSVGHANIGPPSGLTISIQSV